MPDLHLDELCINTIRLLAVDAVEQANSGHPGTSMGAAPMAYVLWDRFLKHNPADPQWPDRDRFVLSPGHASAMLYALLHLTGYDLPLEELKRFRQWESKAPGHPEYGQTPGVEVTTGPLGQGFAHGVGMAVAERWLAEHYNRPGHEIINHYTYAIVSDGDLQEGVASEAASLAGTLRLGKLIYLYDDNDVSIEGNTDIGSADLAPSTYTLLKDHGHYGFEEYCGHNMHFGVREHAMGAIVGGMALHGGTIPYTATFLIFSDYMRPPMRLAALMGQRVIYIFTHDSIGLGEDGPTHQPIEQLMSLRAIPKLVVLRPADATETVEAWKVALERRDGPTAFVFGRQNLPVLNRTTLASAMGVRRGGYILWEASSRNGHHPHRYGIRDPYRTGGGATSGAGGSGRPCGIPPLVGDI